MQDIVSQFGLLALGTRFKRLGDRLQAQTQAYMDELGIDITSAQFPLIATLHRLGPMTIGELADVLGVTQPGVTRSVKQLVEQGYLVTQPGRDDQRRTEVSLSPKAEALAVHSKAEVWPRIEKAVADICGDFGPALLQQLDAIEAGLDEEDIKTRIARHDPQ